MDREGYFRKQVWAFAKHEYKSEEDFFNDLKRLRRKKERKIELLESEVSKRPGLIEDLDKMREKYLAGEYKDKDGINRIPVSAIKKKYDLNRGWILWLSDYITRGKNDPQKLMLEYSYQKNGAVVSERYFALTNDERQFLDAQTRLMEFKQFGFPEQQQRGGAPAGRRTKTVKKYRELLENYYAAYEKEPGLSQSEFCRRNGISRSKLQRAIKLVSQNRL